MASRNTQTVRAIPGDAGTAAAGGAARVTQVVHAMPSDLGTPLGGGSARITQTVFVIIGTVPKRRRAAILTAPVGRLRRLQ